MRAGALGGLRLISMHDKARVYDALAAYEVHPERASARNLVDVIRGDAPNLSHGALGPAAIEVLEAAAQSVGTGR